MVGVLDGAGEVDHAMGVLSAYLPDPYEMDLTQSPDELRRLYLLRYHVRRHSLLRHPDHHLGETQITLYCTSAEQSDPKKGNNDRTKKLVRISIPNQIIT